MARLARAFAALGAAAAAHGACLAGSCQMEPPVDDAAALLQMGREKGRGLGNSDVLTYLRALVRTPDGSPNPRITCTPGNKVARDYLVTTLKSLDVEPLGEEGGYEQVIPGTLEVEGCEEGIANVIGVVRGAKNSDEYVVVAAHLDGPNNQGEFQDEIGNQDTDNAYDDGGAVSVLLSMAKEFIANPPELSVVFFFSSAEEGFSNIGVGSSNPVRARICEATDSLWAELGASCRVDGQFPVGSYAFAINPTFDMSKVRIFVGLDPLGAPGIRGSDLMAVIGSEVFAGLRDLVEGSLAPSKGKVFPAYIARATVGNNYGDLDPWVRKGTPAIWIAQPGFQAYHGGMEYESLQPLLEKAGISEAFWALDRQCSLDLRALVKVAAVLTDMVRNLATDDGTSRPTMRAVTSFALSDAEDAVANYQFAIEGLRKGSGVTGISAEDTTRMQGLLQQLQQGAQQCIEGSAGGPTAPLGEACQGVQSPVALTAAAIMALDLVSSRLGEQGIVGEEPSLPIKCPLRRPGAGR